MSPRQLFQDPYANQAIDLIQEPARARAAALAKIADAQSRATEIGGNAQANAQQQSGQAWAGAAQQIGQSIGSIPGQIQQARMQSLQQKNLQGLVDDRAAQQQARDRENASVAAGSAAIKSSIDPATGQIDYEKAASDWEKAGFPVAANAYRESIQKTRLTAQQLTEGNQKIEAGKKQVQEAAANHLGELALVGLQSLKDKTPLEARDATLGLVANAASHGLISEDSAKQFLEQSASAGPEQLAGIFQKFLDGAPAIKERALKDELTRSEIAKNTAAAVKVPVPKSLQSENEWQVDGKSAPVIFNPATGARYLSEADVMANKPIDPSRLRKIPPASQGGLNTGQKDDVSEAVRAMKEGTVPPLLPGRASKEYLATIAEAHRQGYDLQAAVTDWNATQKHIASMNSNQQLRLKQSINALPELLDSVDKLASQWKGGRFPLLNKANLALAKGGAYGSEVASIANKLDAQIADVNSDLAVVYMGGNSPTDHGLALAAKGLSGDWDEKVLHDMVNLGKNNVTIRRNSIRNTGVAGASADNPYAPKPAAPVAEEWTRDASGKLVKKGG